MLIIYMMVLIISSLVLSSILFFVTMTTSKKSINWREKWSPFECGFDFFNSPRIPFSMRFFLIAIIFIIFDVEIALIIPAIPSSASSSMVNWFWGSSIIMMIIILGVFLEWKEGSLEWKN